MKKLNLKLNDQIFELTEIHNGYYSLNSNSLSIEYFLKYAYDVDCSRAITIINDDMNVYIDEIDVEISSDIFDEIYEEEIIEIENNISLEPIKFVIEHIINYID